MSKESARLCLFVKAPAPGRAKTRLASVLGSSGAAALARSFLLDSLAIWQELGDSLLIAQTGTMDEQLDTKLAGLSCISQGEGSLGERMERVLRAGLEQADVAVAVGTDIPGLGVRDYQESLAMLEHCDAVVGPAEDGGFYLLALRSCPEGLLRDIPWSSPDTFERTVAALEAAGLKVEQLAAKFDVDEAADLPRLRHFMREHPETLPHTRALLSSRSISIIIPVLGEGARLRALLDSLRRMQGATTDGIVEVIVVDGGSRDDSVAIASSVPGIRVLRSEPGRARQMNHGAAEATGGILLFLHADTKLPENFAALIGGALADASTVGGAFRIRTRYDGQGTPRRWVRPFLRLADMRSRYSGLPYGDQAIFVRADAFRELGGFPELPLFEDLAFSEAMRERGELAILTTPVVVSGRRFQERPFYYFALMNSFPALYRLGVSPERLARFYKIVP